MCPLWYWYQYWSYNTYIRPKYRLYCIRTRLNIDIVSFQSKSNNSFVEKQHPKQYIHHICWCDLGRLISRFLIGLKYRPRLRYFIWGKNLENKRTRSFNDIIHISTIVNKLFATSSESNCSCSNQWCHIVTEFYVHSQGWITYGPYDMDHMIWTIWYGYNNFYDWDHICMQWNYRFGPNVLAIWSKRDKIWLQIDH